MQRYTISLEDSLAAQFDEWIDQHGYSNRSEAVRDLLRARLADESLNAATTPTCVATASYVYDHHERELGRRLTHAQHEHHDLNVSTLHVHLNHEQCLEIVVLRGATAEVLPAAQALIAERGVRHGKIQLLPVESSDEHTHPHPHVYTRAHKHGRSRS